MWLKVWRDSSAMAGRPYYAEFNSEEEIDSITEYFDEMIQGDGYHNLNWKKIDKPPIDWLKKEALKYSERLKNLYPCYKQNRIKLQDIIHNYKAQIRNYNGNKE